MSSQVQLIYFALAQAAMASLLAASYGLAWQASGVFHLAMGAVIVIAPYAASALNGAGVPLAASVVAGLALSAAVSVLIERFAYRPLPQTEKIGAMVSSLGVGIILTNLIAVVFGTGVTSVRLLPEKMIPLPGGSLSLLQSSELVVALLVVMLLFQAMRRTLTVQGAWLMAEKPQLATALGLPLQRLKTALMATSGALAGLAGVFLAADGGVTPHAGTGALLTGAIAVMAGGGRSPLGWVAGAFLVAFVQVGVSWWFPGQWGEATAFAVLAGVLWVRPGGLAAVLEREAA